MSEFGVLPVAIGEYLHHGRLDVDDEVAQVVELFSEFGGHEVPWAVDMQDRGGDAVAERLRTWSSTPAGDSVLYWVGHGWSDTRTASLAHARSPKAVAEDGVTPAALARRIAEWEGAAAGGSWAIVIIDACRSARFVELLNAAVDDHQGPRRLLLVGVSAEGSTTLGRFTAILNTVLRGTFRADPEIQLWQLWLELKRNLPEKAQVILKHVDRTALCRAVAPVAASAPLDVVAEVEAVMADLTEDERRHFVPKAQGAELGELSWYFEGRRAERAQIVSWLRDPTRGLLVVTGDAGSGKSALLGHLVVQSRPQLRQVIERHNLTAQLPADQRPPDDVFDAVLHLTGLGSAEVISRFAADLAVGAPPDEADLREQVAWLCSAVDGKPCTILVDALDEAVSPLTIARVVLRPLAAVPSVRVVVGTRRSTQEGPDQPRLDDRDLLDALGAADNATIVVERDVVAIARYVHRRLTAAVSRGLLPADDVTITTVAAAIGGTGQQFLFARLAVHEIIARPELLTEAGLPELLTTDHRELFATAVTRLSRDKPTNGPLLQALAYSRGRGLPMRGGVWSAMASALTGGDEVTDADAGSLLEAAAPYVMLDREHGQTVYRLAHRTFAEHFTVEADVGGEVRPDDRRRHHTIALRLIAHAEADSAAELNPYLVRYLSAHVGAAGEQAWQHLADRPGLLDRLDPNAVGTDAMRTAFGRLSLPPEIAGVVGAHHLLAGAIPGDRAGLRQLAMTRHAGIGCPGASGGADSSTWTVLWANMPRQPTHLTLAGGTPGVTAVAAIPGPDGRMLLASGIRDGTVRIWDPATGTPIGGPLTGHTDGVTAVAAVPGPDGGMLLASGSIDRSVRIWNPATGAPVGKALTGHTSWVSALAAVSGPGGRMLLASGSADRTVRLWDPATGKPIGHPLIGSEEVRAVAAVPGFDSHSLVASGGIGGTVRIWDPATGTLVREMLTGGGVIFALVAVPGLDKSTLLAIGKGHARVRLWNPITGIPVGKTLSGHTGWVTAMAAVRGSDGRMLLATGSNDSTVRLWDPDTSAPVGEVLRGHIRGVTALVAVSNPGGRMLLASGSEDGTVRVWDPDTDAPISEVLSGHTSSVTAVATVAGPNVPMLLATGSNDAVRVWDPDTGVLVGEALSGHIRGVTAVVALRNQQMLLATGSNDSTVRVWDPDTSILVGKALSGCTDRVRDLAAHSARPIGKVTAAAEVTGSDGRTLLAIVRDDGTVQVWNPDNGTPVGEVLGGHIHRVTALVAVSNPGGRMLLASGSEDGAVRLWDPDTGAPIGEVLSGHTSSVLALTAMPGPHGQNLLATGSQDCTVRLWDLATGTQVSVLYVGVSIHALCALSPSQLAAGTSEGVFVLVVRALVNG